MIIHVEDLDTAADATGLTYDAIEALVLIANGFAVDQQIEEYRKEQTENCDVDRCPPTLEPPIEESYRSARGAYTREIRSFIG